MCCAEIERRETARFPNQLNTIQEPFFGADAAPAIQRSINVSPNLNISTKVFPPDDCICRSGGYVGNTPLKTREWSQFFGLPVKGRRRWRCEEWQRGPSEEEKAPRKGHLYSRPFDCTQRQKVRPHLPPSRGSIWVHSSDFTRVRHAFSITKFQLGSLPHKMTIEGFVASRNEVAGGQDSFV